MSAPSEDRVRMIRTPEGLSLPFRLASVRERVSALLADFMIMVVLTVLVLVAALVLASVSLTGLALSVAIGASFILWNFYFMFNEAWRGGTTYGKRTFRLRVVARDGGPLRFEAIFARNVMRNLELNLPLAVLVSPQLLFPSVPAWGRWLAALWVLVFALMPLFNRDRLRCGDLVGGTIVVRQPISILLSDLAEEGGGRRVAPAIGAAPPERFPFDRAQLAIYGVKELQVLEDLLRRANEGRLESQVLVEVGVKIRTKIGWTQPLSPADNRPFLDAFYRAQRAHLEGRLLFGQRKESKSG